MAMTNRKGIVLAGESGMRPLKDGSPRGVSVSSSKPPKPERLAQVFILGCRFIGNGAAALVLGDKCRQLPVSAVNR